MLYFVVTLIFFSSIEVVSKDLMRFLGPFEMTFFRFAIGAAGLAFYSLAKGSYKELSKLRAPDYSLFALLGFINIFFSMSVLQYAIKYGSPAVVALIFSSNPIFVYAFLILLKKEKVSLKKISGFTIGITGLTLVLLDDIGNFELEKGAIFALAGSISFAIFTILNRKAVTEHRPIVVNMVSFAFGLGFIAVYLSWTGQININAELFGSNIRILKLLYLGIFVTAVGYITFLTAIKKMGPVASSLIFLFKPALATLFAVVFISEQIGPNFFAGLLLSSVGSYMVIRKNKNRVIKCVQSA
ncbi:MAG: DMT family transporter [Candidatus Delongbacteria bacterium]